jgi:Uma2 family endonuclease
MSATAEARDERLTYDDIQSLPGEERWELIDGVPRAMSPAPLVRHQLVSGNLYFSLRSNPNNSCFTGYAPMDFVLDEWNVVQPDVFLVCDSDQVQKTHVDGPPALAIEIISPSSEVRDRREKLRLYEKFGVREYVVVFPEREYVERYLLTGGRYALPEIFTWEETLRLNVVDVEIPLWKIFEKTPPGSEESESLSTDENPPAE